MFEARLTEGHILKKIIECIKDLFTDVTINVSMSGKFIFTTHNDYRHFSLRYGQLSRCPYFPGLEPEGI
jgi:hypothetical protein